MVESGSKTDKDVKRDTVAELKAVEKNKNKEGKQNKPIRGKAKGIVIKEAETDTADSTEKRSTKRKREYVVKSSYSLRSGLKGPGVEKTKAEKGKEKIAEVAHESETDSNEVCKRAKNDKDGSDDSDGDGGEKSNYKSLFGLKLDLKKTVEALRAAGFNVTD